MPKRGSDVQLTQLNQGDTTLNVDGTDPSSDPVAAVYWELKHLSYGDQLHRFENWLSREYKGAEDPAELRKRFHAKGKEDDSNSTMSKRATDAQLARRKIATPKGRPGGLRGAPLSTSTVPPSAPQTQQPAAFGGFGAGAQQNGGFNFQFGGNQPAPSFSTPAATPASSAAPQGNFNFSFGGFGQSQQQPNNDATPQQQQQQSQPNGVFSGFGASSQPQSPNPFGSTSASFTFGQTPPNQDQQAPQQPNAFGSTSQSFGGQPSTGIFSGGFGQKSSAETTQPQQPALFNNFAGFGQTTTSQSQQPQQSAPLFSNFSQPAATTSGGFSFSQPTSKAPTTSSGGFNWGSSSTAQTTTQPSSSSQPAFSFTNSASPSESSPFKAASTLGDSQPPKPVFNFTNPNPAASSQPQSTSAPIQSSTPSLFAGLGQQPQPAPREQQQEQMKSSSPPAQQSSQQPQPTASSTPQQEPGSAYPLTTRREWCDAFDKKLGVKRQTNPLDPQPEVLSAFSHLWKVEKKADGAAQQLSTVGPVTVADTTPASPAKGQTPPAKRAFVPSSLSKYDRPYEQLTMADWNTLSKAERLNVVQGAFKVRVAACEPDTRLLALAESFVATWKEVDGGSDSVARTLFTKPAQQAQSFPASSSAAPIATPATKPTGGLFAAGGFGGFSTPQPSFNKATVQEAPKTVAAPTGGHPSDQFFSSFAATKRKASEEDINTTSTKKSKDDAPVGLFGKANGSPTKAGIGSTQTSGFSFKNMSSSTAPSNQASPKPTGGATESNTANIFKDILDKKQDSQPTSQQSNPFAFISTKPSTDAAPSAPSIITASADSPFKSSQQPSFGLSNNFFSSTPNNTSKSTLFGMSPSKTDDTSKSSQPTTSSFLAPSPAKETAAADKSAGATPSTGSASTSGGLFGFGNVAPPPVQSTPTTGGLFKFNTQPATNGSASAPPKPSAVNGTTFANGSAETPKANPFANLLGSKAATVQKPQATVNDDNSGSVFNSPNLKPTIGSSNIFGHLSDVESLSNDKKSSGGSAVEISSDEDEDDDDEGELDAEEAGRLFEGDEDRNGQDDAEGDTEDLDDETAVNGSLGAPAVQPPSLMKKRSGPFAEDDTDESEQDQAPKRRRNAGSPEKNAPTPAAGRGGLFDRISYSKEGAPEREASKEDSAPAEAATPKASSNLFGFSNATQNTPLFNFGKQSPVGDHTWKPESPIKFGSSVNNTANTPKPLFNFQPASPSQPSTEDKENTSASSESPNKPFSTLFGKSTGASSTSTTPLQTATNTAPTASVGFNFGLAPPSGAPSSIFTSAVTSRATTPGASSAAETDGGEEEEQPKDEQNDLMGLNAMREANDVEFECDKAAAYKLVTGEGWTKLGVGPVFVLKERETGVRSVRMVADGVGRVLINSRIAAGNGYKVPKEKQATFVVPGMGNVSMRFRTAEEAEQFVKSCNQ